jgi:hypothetical protein
MSPPTGLVFNCTEISMNQIDEMVEALLAAGAKEFPSPSRKYRKFSYPLSKVCNRYCWLGKSGGIRIGMTSSHNISMTHQRDSILMALRSMKGINSGK